MQIVFSSSKYSFLSLRDSAFCSPPNPTPTCIPTMTSPGVPWERSRSSTWPVPDPDQVMTPYYRNESQSNVSPEFVEMGQKEFDRDPPTQAGDDTKQLNASPDVIGTQRPTPEPKKPRNPWGEMSYADLITKAILSSANKRLTLSEIYTWMIENVNYFREKANETSTSGWKVCREIFTCEHVAKTTYQRNLYFAQCLALLSNLYACSVGQCVCQLRHSDEGL